MGLIMGVSVMVLGQSGTGKSSSLRDLDPETTIVVQAVKKPLPFKSDWKYWDSSKNVGQIITSDNSEFICKIILNSHKHGKKQIIIDDFQYVMANEFMRRSAERGYDKFTEISKHAWDIAMATQDAPEDVTIYILSHTEMGEGGQTKIKTIGKMLDEKITLEGLFSIVLKTHVEDGQYKFSTQNSGFDTVKTPMGMFEQPMIPNNLNSVDKTIREYYGI